MIRLGERKHAPVCLTCEAMDENLHAVTPITVESIEAARARIAGTILRTPLVKLETGTSGPQIYLKLENLQPINSFKLRGAANAVALLAPERRALGVWTISAGNAGQGVAYAARQAGVPCTVVTIETAPETKMARMRALGAHLVKASWDACWEAMERRTFPGVTGTFVHPFDDDNFIAGNATMGLEIVEDLPDVVTVITAIGGGGLVTGVASGILARKPDVRIFVAEPETAAPASISFSTGKASVFDAWQATFVDGAGGKSVFPRMWERMRPLVDGSIVVTLEETKRAMRMLAEKSRVIAEGAGALAVAAALSGRAGHGPIVAVVSGGNVELSAFCELIGAGA
jgi:threonine dehydratase